MLKKVQGKGSNTRHRGGCNPATAETESGTSDNVEVLNSASKRRLDFGTIIQGEKVAYPFKFKNSGKADFIITSAKGSCGCTVPEWPKEPIAPKRRCYRCCIQQRWQIRAAEQENHHCCYGSKYQGACHQRNS